MQTYQLYKWLSWGFGLICLLTALYLSTLEAGISYLSPWNMMLLALTAFFHSYQYTEYFRNINNIQALIRRDGKSIAVFEPRYLPFQSLKQPELIEVARISQMTIYGSMLSLILDGNGKGYDFYLPAEKLDISSRLTSLFNQQELENISLQII